MSDFFEVIAQQIDRLAEKPLDVALLAGGGWAMWSWFGWIGLVIIVVFFAGVALIGDVVVYALRGYTYARYKNTELSINGFHPFKARSMARSYDRAIKTHGKETVIAELEKLGALVTHTDKEAS